MRSIGIGSPRSVTPLLVLSCPDSSPYPHLSPPYPETYTYPTPLHPTLPPWPDRGLHATDRRHSDVSLVAGIRLLGVVVVGDDIGHEIDFKETVPARGTVA